MRVWATIWPTTNRSMQRWKKTWLAKRSGCWPWKNNLKTPPRLVELRGAFLDAKRNEKEMLNYRWWFHTCFNFQPEPWGNDPIWLITTNQISFKKSEKWVKSLLTWRVAGSHAGWLNPDFCVFFSEPGCLGRLGYVLQTCRNYKLPYMAMENPQPFMVWNPSFLVFGVQRYFSNSVIWFTTTWNSSEYQKLFNIDSINGNI